MFPRSGIKVARIFGIDIVINPTWILIFALVGISMGDTFRIGINGITIIGNQTFPGGVWPWVMGFITAAVFFACLLAHEVSHSFIAKRNGIPINRITLFIFGGVAEMSEDVPSAKIELKMAAAGPIVTFVLAGIFYGLYLLAYHYRATPVVVAPLFYLSTFNLFVGVFNLLPGFPLDGGRVLRALIWHFTDDLLKATRIASIGGQVVAALIAGMGAFLLFLDNLISGVWLLLIGAFVFQLSRAGYQQTLLRLASSSARIGDIMYTDVPVVDASTTLTDLRNHYFSSYRLPALPVAEGDRLVGTVERDDLDGIAQAEWDVLNAGRIARPLAPGQISTPDTTVDRVLRTMLTEQDLLVVVDGEEVKGILTREELMRYIETRVKLMGRKTGQ